MEAYERFIKYIYFFIMYVIGFSLMFQTNLELLGLFITIGTNIINNGFLFLDINRSPKRIDSIAGILLIGIILCFISTVLILMTVVKLHSKFSLKNSKIRLSRDYRAEFDSYKQFLVSDIVLINILALLFFTIQKRGYFKNDGTYQYLPAKNGYEYFEFFGWNFYSFFDVISYIIKVCLTIAMLGISGYLIFLSNDIRLLSGKNYDQLYIPDDDPGYSGTNYKKRGFLSTLSHWINNMNINYITGYKINTGLN